MENKNKVVVNGSTKEILKLLKKSGLVVQVGESKIDDVKSEFDNKAYIPNRKASLILRLRKCIFMKTIKI